MLELDLYHDLDFLLASASRAACVARAIESGEIKSAEAANDTFLQGYYARHKALQPPFAPEGTADLRESEPSAHKSNCCIVAVVLNLLPEVFAASLASRARAR
jgi:hypothetical protein